MELTLLILDIVLILGLGVYLKCGFLEIIVSFIGLYFLLKYFITSNLLVSTIYMNINLTTTYLLVRRSRFSFLFYLINAFILLTLWGLLLLNGNIELLPMVFNAMLLLANNLYGLYSRSKNK